MRLIALAFCWACHRPDGGGKPNESQPVNDSDDSSAVDDSGGDSGTGDRDGDGWAEPEDCDDDDFAVHPTAPEACVNHRDDNCDGVVDHCELDIEPNLIRRFVDPDALDSRLGFGAAMGFLEREGNVALWISPQELAPDHVFRAASSDDWPVAEISGSDGVDDWMLGMIATQGDFDGDGERDLVIDELEKDRVVAHLFYDTMTGSATLDDASASISAFGSWDTSDGSTLPGAYALGDMTADGADDLLVCGTTGSWLVAGPISGAMDLSKGGEVAVAWEVADVWFVTSLDFDGDGMRDLATTNPLHDTAGAGAGAAYVYLAPLSSILEPATADRSWYGTYGKFPPTGESAGWQIEGGDFDGEGRDELAIHSYGGFDVSATGIVYIVAEEAPDAGELASVSSARVSGGVADHIGANRGSVADLDEDGVSDLIVSSRGTLPEEGSKGYVSVLLGPFDGQRIADEDANLLLRGPKGGWPGYNVVDGDLDGDGVLELASAGNMLDDDGESVGVVDVVTPGLLFAP